MKEDDEKDNHDVVNDSNDSVFSFFPPYARIMLDGSTNQSPPAPFFFFFSDWRSAGTRQFHFFGPRDSPQWLSGSFPNDSEGTCTGFPSRAVHGLSPVNR